MVTEKFYLDLPFRENRNYVHSASLLTELSQRFQPYEKIELVLKEWMDSRVEFTPVKQLSDVPNATGHVKIIRDQQTYLLALSVDENHKVTQREPYDEDSIVSEAKLSGRELFCPYQNTGRFFERIISGNKRLINLVLQPNVKLIAAKIVIEGCYPDDTDFTLVLKSNIGTRIFKSAVEIDNQMVGEVIYYGQ